MYFTLGENESFACKYRLVLQGLLLSTVALVQGAFMGAVYVLGMKITLNGVSIFLMAVEMNFYTGLWIAMAMSSELRSYSRKLLGKSQVGNQKNGNGQNRNRLSKPVAGRQQLTRHM